MKLPTVSMVNTYTHSPLQHPNIFLGSLQLLFWLVFRPTAWENHIKHLDLSLDKNFSLWQLFTQQRWRQKKLWKFVLQVFILLPILCSLATGAISLGLGTPWPLVASRIAFGVAFGVAVGMVVSVVGGVAVGVAFGVVFGVVFGVAFGVAFGLAFGVVGGRAGGMAAIGLFGVAVGVAGGVAGEGMAVSVAGGVVVGVAGGVVVNMAGGMAISVAGGLAAIGAWVNWWRPTMMAVLLFPWHTLLYRIDEQKIKSSSSLLSKHLAFWDEWQYLPIWGLDKHLLLVIKKNPIEGQAALNYLSTSRQRWAAQTVQIELDALQLEHCTDAAAVGQIQQILVISELASAADTMFRSFNSISVDVNVALRQFSIYNQRLALTDVVNRLNSLIRELTTSSDKYAMRFRPIAQRWQNIIDLHLQDLIKESEERQEIDSPYIIGVPVTNRQQLFVGRTDISEKLEKLLLDRRSPPLLLYGQRRTGKTSLLNNLGRLLPTSIIPLFVDLQGSISSAKDHTGFLYNLAKGMINSAQRQRNLKLPPLSYETLTTDPFTRFDEWLDNLETALAGNTALLALDEFEVLDRVLNEGRFNENDVLGMLRNLIQHRPKFKVLLAGSHTLDEFQRWSSYLINAQLIHLGYLQETEARQLIETPIENFALRYQPPASQRVLDITKGHPFLVQLICAEIVALKNDQDPSIRRLATHADVEAAIPAALEHGSMFFSDIERNQLDAHSLKVLRYLAQQGEGAIISSADLTAHFTERAEIAESISGSIELLLRRELIETKPSGYSIQLELIRRWFI
jgi:hypothetical protein